MVKTWFFYASGHGRASHNGNPGNSWPGFKSIWIDDQRWYPNQWSVIRLCQVETSAQQIKMVPALSTGGYGRVVGELCGPGLPNCVWCYGVTVSPFRWLGFLLLNCFGVAFRIEHGSAVLFSFSISTFKSLATHHSNSLVARNSRRIVQLNTIFSSVIRKKNCPNNAWKASRNKFKAAELHSIWNGGPCWMMVGTGLLLLHV